MSNRDFLIELEQVSKGYTLAGGRRLEVLHQIDGRFPRHAWNVLLGASGSGKTTLLNLLGALESPDSGVLRYDGKTYAELTASGKAAARFRNRTIGFIFQSYQLLPEFSILENVRLPALLAGVPPAAATVRATALLERLGLADRLHHRGSELSGGEQQRAAVARALVNEPELILADEPTGNLDSRTGESLLDLFRELAARHTIVMITHNEALAARADAVVRLTDGVLGEFQFRSNGMRA